MKLFEDVETSQFCVYVCMYVLQKKGKLVKP